MTSLFHEFLTRPLLNLLVFFYQVIPFHDLGLAIILLTVFIRLLLYPFVAKAAHAQKALALLQPEVDKLRITFKDNKEEQAKRLMELYKLKGINPLSGCLPVLIQLPLLFALFSVFSTATTAGALDQLYSFIPHPAALSPIAFGFINLASPSKVLAILAGISQFVQGYVMPQPPRGSTDSPLAQAARAQIYMIPVMITIIGFRFPAALPLYWTILNILGIFQYSGFRPWRRSIPQNVPQK